MRKLKTNKATAKRFRVTGRRKLRRLRKWRNHLCCTKLKQLCRS